MNVGAKRSAAMIFYSDGASHYSHRVRIVLAEKGVSVEVVDVQGDAPEVADLNPYNTLPTLVDRDLVLYESKIMMEYLDERFPHPPLMPVYPVARGESRQLMYRIERDWCRLVDTLAAGGSARALEQPRKELREGLLGVAPIFAEKPYFMSDEFTLVDCCMAPILWRLPSLGVELPSSRQSKPLLAYMDRLFSRSAFQASLSSQERNMRRAA